MGNEATENVPSGHELCRAWSEAPAFLPHGSGCACAGHVGFHLDPAAVEADVLDYLADRYAKLGRTALFDFIERRRQARGVAFAAWLAGLDTAPLPADAAALLKSDLHATIASLARPR